MHIDAYIMPRAPRAATRFDAQPRQRNFIYTGDQFIFTRPDKANPPAEQEACALWLWVKSFFR